MLSIVAGRLGTQYCTTVIWRMIALDFDFSRLRRSDRIVGGGGIALFVFLFFFKWFGLSVSPVKGAGVDHSVNGWHMFTSSR
jgi:hypothetical protein